jgi:hypothetical protein
MENFFIEETFHSDLESLIAWMDNTDVEELPDNWEQKVELSDLEPIFDVNVDNLCQMLADCNEDRLNLDEEEYEEKAIKKALSESIDFNKLNSLLPKYYYPNGKFAIITKQDLINAL